jgi:SNF2 family DNA or RNA helicase
MSLNTPKALQRNVMLIHQPTKSVVLKLRDPSRVLTAFPGLSRSIDADEGNVQIKHTLETTLKLNELGINVPSPILYDYQWPGKYTPFTHQRPMADFHIRNIKNLNLSEMGVGKSFATLWAADYLMILGEVRRVLILAPLSILETIWQQDIFDVLMHRSCVVTHGDREHRLNTLSMDVDFYIANHDMIAHQEVAKLVRKRKDIDLIILDEAHLFRNSRNLTYKFFAWAIENKKRIWLLTGTPCPNAPTDAWALARLVCPSRVPRFFGSFRRMTMQQDPRRDARKWYPVNGYESIVFDALQPAYRIRKRDCMSLPPLIVMNHQTRLTAEQEKQFKLMRDYMILQHKTTKITAVNAADAILKLRQICCGSIKNPVDGAYETIDHSIRLNELISVIKQASAKVIVVVPFKGITRALEAELASHFSLAVLNGDVSITQRNRIIRAFKSGPDPHVLLCHPQVMAHGLNLTEADTTIFYAPIYSHDQYAQVIERFNRAGQTRKMTVVRIAAHSLAWDIYSLLDNRATNQDNILRLYEKVIL